MLLAAAVCPHPPLLVPQLTGASVQQPSNGPAAAVAALRETALAAVRDLLAVGDEAGTDLDVVVVGTGPTPGSAAPDAVGSLAGYGADVTVALTRGEPGTAAPSLPLSVTVGVWLLREAGYPGPVRARVVTEHATPAECADLGARIAAFPTPTVLLVMGDGSASRDEKAPGALDPRAVPFDTAVADALAAVDTAALGALDPALARELLAAGRAPWQILAGAVEADGRPWKGELRSTDAPYGVGYLVASWSPV
ncbi:class III extradiol dioxygenase subunit B-like domain-containing protein [Cryptosporangium aurantiacum]|uniref:Catalytic LigB subunit of aromatic ring-opening dioxygenase n=1 Tax=Cryptosporangium aurantiacum TaxID=134849 RepID=A0A1M7IWN4_9ACTN|nr:class III extradiol dioxygenase subunit B-like domain-containing protein [Cryptosporangium aurantiacum]SHM45146.1 hypothetical protein SAMN05443668_101614 [Cryptosporangium aurantiacum]